MLSSISASCADLAFEFLHSTAYGHVVREDRKVLINNFLAAVIFKGEKKLKET